ncbi:hypothetical protein GDO81_027823 [Engystomops pustulosus]|uniref:Uncharacterized protein n=1 Tax=Engystomops pustulosus TaxID=76066 RepID=A0AAV6YDZ5_ENGPU|nr:hypothetical protein GDO81_027823 [Engystomops pustulosus]
MWHQHNQNAISLGAYCSQTEVMMNFPNAEFQFKSHKVSQNINFLFLLLIRLVMCNSSLYCNKPSSLSVDVMSILEFPFPSSPSWTYRLSRLVNFTLFPFLPNQKKGKTVPLVRPTFVNV